MLFKKILQELNKKSIKKNNKWIQISLLIGNIMMFKKISQRKNKLGIKKFYKIFKTNQKNYNMQQEE